MAKELLINWLNDAYAMEKSQEKMLQGFIKDFEGHEETQQKLVHHLEQTVQQRAAVQECIKSLDSDTSAIKSVVAGTMGKMQGMGTTMNSDTMVRDMVMIHSGEHMEHAVYTGIAHLADALGYMDIAATCREIAEQEKKIADWSLYRLTTVVEQSLEREIINA